jgi:guanine nucleotide-binding protein G(i) subunit alpha
MAMRKLGVDPEEPNNRAHADRILEYRMDTDPLSVLPQDILLAIESLWHDPVIPSVMDRSSEFYLMDSATYFFANIRKIGAVDYVPDEADVLRARTKTTGISETRFNMGQLSIHMFDVGGQRSERKKWIHCGCCFGSSYILSDVPGFVRQPRQGLLRAAIHNMTDR